ncbi:MAG TPA: hypothetical protein VIT92_12440 [Burkholderiaceae bacterium]
MRKTLLTTAILAALAASSTYAQTPSAASNLSKTNPNSKATGTDTAGRGIAVDTKGSVDQSNITAAGQNATLSASGRANPERALANVESNPTDTSQPVDVTALRQTSQERKAAKRAATAGGATAMTQDRTTMTQDRVAQDRANATASATPMTDSTGMTASTSTASPPATSANTLGSNAAGTSMAGVDTQGTGKTAAMVSAESDTATAGGSTKPQAKSTKKAKKVKKAKATEPSTGQMDQTR